jgi:hypothetical protein
MIQFEVYRLCLAVANLQSTIGCLPALELFPIGITTSSKKSLGKASAFAEILHLLKIFEGVGPEQARRHNSPPDLVLVHISGMSIVLSGHTLSALGACEVS